MTDSNKVEVKVNDKELEEKSATEKQTATETEKEGEEMKESKTENGEGKNEEKNEEGSKKAQKDDSTLDRFLSWWRGKPKAETNLKDEEENKEKEKDEKIIKKDENDVKDISENEKDEKIIKEEGSETKEKTDEEKDEKMKNESAELINSKVKPQSDSDKSPNDASSRDEKEAVRPSSITERRLEKIVEEQKSAEKTAPLAIEEDEELDSLDSRPTIDRPIAESKVSESYEAGKEFDSKTAKEAEDSSENRKSARVETFVVLGKPVGEKRVQTTDEEAVNTPSEHDELSKVSHREHTEKQGTQPCGKNDVQQSKKMEEVIEERRQDLRKDNVQETWERIETGSPGKETGNKTFRVSYTIRTETIETKKDEDDDDDDEKLFGNSVLLNSAPTRTFEGPPPEELEPEIVEEHAREDEAGAGDIDRFFELCKEDGSAPLAKDETESVPREDQETTPQTTDDIFKKLHSWDDEPTDWWTITKKKKEYEEWMKPMKDGTIRRVIIPCVEIPYETTVRFITDWKHREEWDKTFSEIQVLKTDKQSKVIYCPVKKHDLTFETMEQEETDPPCYILSWKKQEVIDDAQKADTLTRRKKSIQLITHTCGIILRPAESGETSTKITILCQLEGPVDNVLKNTFLSGHPKTWLRNLKKYYKKQQKGDNKKVVYL